MLRRVQGKLAFGTLQDSSGRIQLFAPSQSTPDFEAFCELGLGDWIGVRGVVMTTRRGELSVRVDGWVLLAADRAHRSPTSGTASPTPTSATGSATSTSGSPTRRGAPSCCAAGLVSLTRRWLEDRGFIEVETPVFHPIPGGAAAKPFTTHHNALDLDLYLRIAPELYLKRLIVGGFEKVFEIARVFRNEGIVATPQPRVHDARALRGLRRLRRHDAPHRGARGPPRARELLRHHEAHRTAAASSTSRRRGGGRR